VVEREIGYPRELFGVLKQPWQVCVCVCVCVYVCVQITKLLQ